MNKDRFNAEKVSPDRLDAARIFTLHRMTLLARKLGNPHNSYPSVHVAGSKGKGSICEMTAAGLKGLGLRVGLYTSPDLLDIRERIRVNGEMISREIYDHLVSYVESIIDQEPLLKDITHFERLTCVAFEHFRRCNVDAAVIEVGLGGRDDATNIIVPTISILASIQLEHTQLLGTTLTQIASVKAGIMKPGVRVVSVPQTKEVIDVFAKYAASVGASLEVLGSQIPVLEGAGALDSIKSSPLNHSRGEPRADANRISLEYHDHCFADVPVPLEGTHQVMNCAAALCAISSIVSTRTQSGMDRAGSPGVIDISALFAGLRATPNRGRFEFFESDAGMFILDTAHTRESVRALVNSIHHRFPSRPLYTIFAVAGDKDYAEMLRIIGQSSEVCICTQAANHDRGVAPQVLASCLETIRQQSSSIRCMTVSSSMTLQGAVRELAAHKNLNTQTPPLYLVTGTHAIVGEAMRILGRKDHNTPSMRELR